MAERTVGHHVCPARGCEVYVRDDTLACRKHWFQLPKALRQRIWDEYEFGQSAATMSEGYRECLTAADVAWAERA